MGKYRFNYNTVAALVFIIVAIILLLSVPGQIAKPKLFMGRALTAMQPTLFPYIILSGLLVLSIWYFFHSFKLTESHLFKNLEWQSLIRTTLSLIIFLIYALALEPVGFVISSILLLMILSTLYGNRSWLLGGVISIVVPVAIFILFSRVLKVYLPEGLLA